MSTILREVSRMNTTTDQVHFIMEECCNCGVPFFLPLYLQKRLLETHKSFYCPNGHSMSYTGKTEAQKLQDKLVELQNQANKREQELQDKWLDTLGEKNKLEKQLKKVHNGTCPCCKRSFQNLERHMQSKHPELVTVKRKKP